MKLQRQIAIGNRGSKEVRLWASIEKTDPDGRIHFFVKNGRWAGTFKGGDVYVEETKHTFKNNVILWRGTAPFPWEGYNQAIPWIEAQMARPISSKIVEWLQAIWDLRNYRIKIERKVPKKHPWLYEYDPNEEIPF